MEGRPATPHYYDGLMRPGYEASTLFTVRRSDFCVTLTLGPFSSYLGEKPTERQPSVCAECVAERVAMSKMGARHLLIKFEGSRNPVSRRTNQSTASVTADAAQKELQEYIDKIQVSLPVPSCE